MDDKLISKAGTQTEADPFEFVLSTEQVDRAGDVIRMNGLDLGHFKANPIALFGHEHDKIIGVWENVRVEGKQLIGRLKMAKAGTSDLVDTVTSLIEQRIIKAVSVGFQAIEMSPRKGGSGYEFIKSSLHEASVVAVPMNPGALAVAKAMNPEVAEYLFVKPDSVDAAMVPGQLTTPNLDAARAKFKDIL